MSTVKFQDKITVKLSGEQPKVGTMAPNFELVRKNLSTAKLSDYRGKRVVLNISPASIRASAQHPYVASTLRLLSSTTPSSSASLRICPSHRLASAVLRV